MVKHVLIAAAFVAVTMTAHSVETPRDGIYIADRSFDMVFEYVIGRGEMTYAGTIDDVYHDVSVKIANTEFELKIDFDNNGRFSMNETWYGNAYVFPNDPWMRLYRVDNGKTEHVATFIYDDMLAYSGSHAIHIRLPGADHPNNATWYVIPMKPVF